MANRRVFEQWVKTRIFPARSLYFYRKATITQLCILVLLVGQTTEV